MNRIATTALLLLGGLSLAACGSAATATSSKPTPSPTARVRNGAAGELVKITGTQLILSSTTGDATVDYTATTTFQRTSTGTLADITTGRCIVVTGQKDATGALIAAGVRLSSKVNGTCAAPAGGAGPGGPGGPGGGTAPTPSPGATPRPSFAAVAGEVTGVNGTTIKVTDITGAVQSLTVPTTVTVSKSAVAAATDLALHQCLQAQGTRDSAGVVTARSITIVPASATGCTFGGGGFGRFGGGRPGGGGGTPGGGAPPGGAAGG
jgi:hypothetical protein